MKKKVKKSLETGVMSLKQSMNIIVLKTIKWLNVIKYMETE